MGLIRIRIRSASEIEVLPELGGERLVSAFFRSLTGKSQAVECYGIPNGRCEFMICGTELNEVVPLSIADARSIEVFLKGSFKAQTLGRSPENGFSLISN
ncbi:MAG: hypothetical protein WCG01_05270 [bacterium]